MQDWYTFGISCGACQIRHTGRETMATNTPSILIVENERIIAEYMGVVLLRHGYSVSDVVTSGEEAIVAALRTNPDLVLMDIKLDGGMDGVVAAAMIQDHADIPIIYVTACTDMTVFERALVTNPSAYLHKPFKANELIGSIQRTLNGRRGSGIPEQTVRESLRGSFPKA